MCIRDSDYVWIESVNVFAKIKLACQNEGILFDLSRQELYQKLESEKLLITKDNRRSYEYRKGQFRQSVICLDVYKRQVLSIIYSCF